MQFTMKESLRTMRNIHRDSRKQVKSSGTAMRTVPTGEQTKKSAETIHVLAEVEGNIKTAAENNYIFRSRIIIKNEKSLMHNTYRFMRWILFCLLPNKFRYAMINKSIFSNYLSLCNCPVFSTVTTKSQFIYRS